MIYLIEDMMNTIMETMGIDPDMLDTMQNMYPTKMFNRMDYTVLGLLPIFIFIVIVANSIVVNQVDQGSMAYVLSTPTKRSAVTITQAIFLIVSPLIITAITCIKSFVYDVYPLPSLRMCKCWKVQFFFLNTF